MSGRTARSSKRARNDASPLEVAAASSSAASSPSAAASSSAAASADGAKLQKPRDPQMSASMETYMNIRGRFDDVELHIPAAPSVSASTSGSASGPSVPAVLVLADPVLLGPALEPVIRAVNRFLASDFAKESCVRPVLQDIGRAHLSQNQRQVDAGKLNTAVDTTMRLLLARGETQAPASSSSSAAAGAVSSPSAIDPLSPPLQIQVCHGFPACPQGELSIPASMSISGAQAYMQTFPAFAQYNVRDRRIERPWICLHPAVSQRMSIACVVRSEVRGPG